MRQKDYARLTEKELVGRKAKTTRLLRSGAIEIQAGKIVTITRKFGGLNITADACPHCGIGVRMTKVGPSDLELI